MEVLTFPVNVHIAHSLKNIACTVGENKKVMGFVQHLKYIFHDRKGNIQQMAVGLIDAVKNRSVSAFSSSSGGIYTPCSAASPGFCNFRAKALINFSVVDEVCPYLFLPFKIHVSPLPCYSKKLDTISSGLIPPNIEPRSCSARRVMTAALLKASP